MGGVTYRPTTCKLSIITSNQTPGKRYCHFDFVICYRIDKILNCFLNRLHVLYTRILKDWRVAKLSEGLKKHQVVL